MTAIKPQPIITCKPWNPVVKKNELPYTESDIEKGLIMYSNACNAINIKPRRSVDRNAICPSSQLELSNAIWAQVIEPPLDSNNVVLSKGTSKGLFLSTPVGGQLHPISTLGLSEAWKKAQKKEKNKNSSLTMKRIIPMRIPSSTFDVCLPR